MNTRLSSRMANRVVTASLAVFMLLLGNLTVTSSRADSLPSFATANVDIKGSAIASFAAGAQSGTASTTDQLVGISSDGSSALWVATLNANSLGLILRTNAGTATLFPKTLIDPQKALFPTANGVVVQQGTTFSYLSADSAVAGSPVTKLGTIPTVTAGYFRDVSSITAVDGAVYVSTVDYQIAATDPTLGLSHVWYITGDSAIEAFSASSQYITSLQISPSDAAKFAALFVRVGNRNTFYGQATGTIAPDHTITLDALPTWMATNPAMLDQNLGWLLQDTNYIPAIVDVLSSNTVVHTFAGNTLALFPAKSNIVLAPSIATFDVSAPIRNKIQRTITANPVMLPVIPFNTVLTNVGLATSSSLGYTDAISVPLFITVGTKTTPFVLNKKATANFCLSASVTENGPLAAATGTFCAKVQAMLKVTAKKRVFTVLTSSKKLVIETLVKKKWAVAKLKYKLVKGKALITVKPGSYRFSVLATATNDGIASANFKIK